MLIFGVLYPVEYSLGADNDVIQLPMTETSLSPSSVLLSLATLSSAYLTFLSLTPPNPPRRRPHAEDGLSPFVGNARATQAMGIVLSILALCHVVIVLTYPHIPPFLGPYFKDNEPNLDLFNWSASTAIPLFLSICVGAPLRLFAFKGLGTDFTFRLAEPDRLVTTGLYRYVQHPSYTGLAIIMAANMALWGRSDGAISAWFSPRYMRWIRCIEPSALCVVAITTLAMSAIRIRDEENMLKAKFGNEWEAWHAKTKRLIPGVI